VSSPRLADFKDEPHYRRIGRKFRRIGGRGSLSARRFRSHRLADEWSDYDLYANTRGVVPIEFRAKLLKPRAARLELHNTFWKWSDEWGEPDGTIFDLMYRSCDAIEADVEAKLRRGVAALGYSTSLCYSVLQATPIFDRRGWFKALQSRLKSTPYPDVLMEGIIKMNLPVLGV
jgi:hypothetical protein